MVLDPLVLVSDGSDTLVNDTGDLIRVLSLMEKSRYPFIHIECLHIDLLLDFLQSFIEGVQCHTDFSQRLNTFDPPSAMNFFNYVLGELFKFVGVIELVAVFRHNILCSFIKPFFENLLEFLCDIKEIFFRQILRFHDLMQFDRVAIFLQDIMENASCVGLLFARFEMEFS